MSKVKGTLILAVLAMGLLAIPACGRTEPSRNDQQTARNEVTPPASEPSATNPTEPPGPPFEQGTSDADVQTTQRVRQGVMDDTGLSTTAKNVKIITRDGKVLLLGPVTSEQERSRIQSIAEEVAGAGNVRSEMEVTHA